MKIVHVYPAGEAGHVLDGACPCRPEEHPVERDDGPPGWVVTHQSLGEKTEGGS